MDRLDDKDLVLECGGKILRHKDSQGGAYTPLFGEDVPLLE
jgi:hypothetical protein